MNGDAFSHNNNNTSGAYPQRFEHHDDSDSVAFSDSNQYRHQQHHHQYADAGAVGTHTSGAIAGQARHSFHADRLPNALDRIFAMNKVRLAELGRSDDFGAASNAGVTNANIFTAAAATASTASTSSNTPQALLPNPASSDAIKRREKNREKRKKQKQQRKQQKSLASSSIVKHDNDDKSSLHLDSGIEIEYVPEEVTFSRMDDRSSFASEFSRIFSAFQQLSAKSDAKKTGIKDVDEDADDNNSSDAANKTEESEAAAQSKQPANRLTKQPVDLHEEEADDESSTSAKKAATDKQVAGDDSEERKALSRRKLKRLLRPSVADLKRQVERSDVVEFHDVTSPDPKLLILLKAYRSTVPVPRHWCFKRKYLTGKRGFEKPPFALPEFIRKTGIMEMRDATAEKDDSKTLKQKMREKVRPKMGKIDINYQKLHDAFFKWQTKPRMSMHGDLYFEGKETESKLRDKKPGIITNDLRLALGMPIGPNAHKFPPPWLIAMQRYGPPPSYPELKVAGLNAPIPEGCTFGYHAGGWGKPPVDERGRPLYGDVFGVAGGAAGALAEKVDETALENARLWGEPQYDVDNDDDDEEEEAEEAAAAGEGEDGEPVADKDGAVDAAGTETPAALGGPGGLVTPSGTISSSIPAGLETPVELELRKQRIEKEMEAGDDQRPLYTVLPERRVDRSQGAGTAGAAAMLGSTHLYDLRGSGGGGAAAASTAAASNNVKSSDVILAIDPSEIEKQGGLPRQHDVEKRYNTKVDEQRHQLEKEDFSDMVAEHAARQAQKRRKQQEPTSKGGASGGGGSAPKKQKDFKF